MLFVAWFLVVVLISPSIWRLLIHGRTQARWAAIAIGCVPAAVIVGKWFMARFASRPTALGARRVPGAWRGRLTAKTVVPVTSLALLIGAFPRRSDIVDGRGFARGNRELHGFPADLFWVCCAWMAAGAVWLLLSKARTRRTSQ